MIANWRLLSILCLIIKILAAVVLLIPPVLDPGSNNSGNYELQAVLTHQGRSSSSGHYLAWVKHSGNVWLKLDDDKVSMVLEEDILKLSGGGK